MLILISFLEGQKRERNRIENLCLERINCSTTILFKFCRSLEDFNGLKFLSLAGNHLPYFCVDGLLSQETLPESLNLSDTQLDDLSAYHLVSGLIKRHQCEVREINLSQNPLLGFAFFSKLVDLLEVWEQPINLKCINLENCTISVQCQQKLASMLKKRRANNSISSNLTTIYHMDVNKLVGVERDVTNAKDDEEFSLYNIKLGN